MRIGVLGGTGPAGSALAARMADSGVQVLVGSRDLKRSSAVVDDLLRRWPRLESRLLSASNEQAAEAPLVVVATPWDAALDVAVAAREALRGKVVVSMANALAKLNGEIQALYPSRGSVAASLAACLPEARVVAAFHHLPAGKVAALDERLEGDVLICSDDEEAAEEVAELARRIPDLRALVVGGLWAASPIEAFTAVLINLNIRYRGHASLRITGLERSP